MLNFYIKNNRKMGNAQTSVCFRAAWTKSDDPNDARAVKQLWPLEVKDVDLV